MSGEAQVNNADVFRRRVRKMVDCWTGATDCLLLITGQNSEDASYHKTMAMHYWLLGIEFPDTVIALTKSGHVIFLASRKKLDLLRHLESPEVVFLPPFARPATADPFDLTSQVEAIVTQVRGERSAAGTEAVSAGMLQKEKHIGPFADAFRQAVDALQQRQVLRLAECRDEISSWLAAKDPQEIELLGKAAKITQQFMKHFVLTVEDIVDADTKKTNRQVCEMIEELAENDSGGLTAKWCQDLGLDASEPELMCVSLMSGTTFDLKPATEPTDDVIPMSGCYVLSLAMTYSNYASCVTRTLLVDPTSRQKEAYALALDVLQTVVDALRPGVLFKDVYVAARGVVQKQKSELCDKFVKNVGFVTGLEFQDKHLVLTEKSDKVVRPGMSFSLSAGFSVAAGMADAKPWAVWVGDSCYVPLEADEAGRVTTGDVAKAAQLVTYELGEEEPVPAAVAAAASTTPAGKEGKGPAPESASKKAAKPKPEAAKKSAAAEKQAPAAKRKREVSPPPPGRVTRASAQAAPQSSNAGPRLATHVKSAAILETRTRAKNLQTKQDMSEMVKLDGAQKEYRMKKQEELQQRLASGDMTSRGNVEHEQKRLHECRAYANPDDFPKRVEGNRVQIDTRADALIVPVCGNMVPFHVRTIKNMSTRAGQDGTYFLRINFFYPGAGKSLDDYPESRTGQRAFVKELSFRSTKKDNFDAVIRDYKEVQKNMKQREIERGVKVRTDGQVLQLRRSGAPNIRDLNMRPTLGAGARRTQGTLEAHENGFRFFASGGTENVDVFYSQVKAAIYEPCENDNLIVLVHLHLKDAMMIGKKKTYDVQFFTEVKAQSEDLSMRRHGSAHDPDEIQEEQRDEELKARLNKYFLDWAKKAELIPGCPKFEIPFKDLSFKGVPQKSSIMLTPCNDVLCGLQEWPPFCLSIGEVDIVCFERVGAANLREFDLVFVKRDYDELPIRICSIPRSCLDNIKLWLSTLSPPVVWYDSNMNMAWANVMKHVTTNFGDFVEEGGWNGLFAGGAEDGSDESQGGSGSDFSGHEGDANASSDAAESDDFDAMDEEEDDDDESCEEESDDGKSWDELDREAEQADRRRDVATRQTAVASEQAPIAKRTRRR